MKRPLHLTIIGTLNIIICTIGIFSGIKILSYLKGDLDLLFNPIPIFIYLTGLIGGIGLLYNKKWSKNTCIAYSIGTILFFICGLILTLILVVISGANKALVLFHVFPYWIASMLILTHNFFFLVLIWFVKQIQVTHGLISIISILFLSIIYPFIVFMFVNSKKGKDYFSLLNKSK